MRKECNRIEGEKLIPYRKEIKKLHFQKKSADEIAYILGKERTTIIYHLKFQGLKPYLKETKNFGKFNDNKPARSNKEKIQRLNKQLDKKYLKYKVNKGKLTYSEYLEAEKLRRKKL